MGHAWQDFDPPWSFELHTLAGALVARLAAIRATGWLHAMARSCNASQRGFQFEAGLRWPTLHNPLLRLWEFEFGYGYAFCCKCPATTARSSVAHARVSHVNYLQLQHHGFINKQVYHDTHTTTIGLKHKTTIKGSYK
eukprot:6469292-Amphidinium_carterae.1